MTPEEKFFSLVKSSKEAIEDFNDFADDKAIVWAADELAAMTERIRKLDDELTFKLAELELMVRFRSSIKELLFTEREVSNKLVAALNSIGEYQYRGINDVAKQFCRIANTAIAEVETIRTKGEQH